MNFRGFGRTFPQARAPPALRAAHHRSGRGCSSEYAAPLDGKGPSSPARLFFGGLGRSWSRRLVAVLLPALLPPARRRLMGLQAPRPCPGFCSGLRFPTPNISLSLSKLFCIFRFSQVTCLPRRAYYGSDGANRRRHRPERSDSSPRPPPARGGPGKSHSAEKGRLNVLRKWKRKLLLDHHHTPAHLLLRRKLRLQHELREQQ